MYPGRDGLSNITYVAMYKKMKAALKEVGQGHLSHTLHLFRKAKARRLDAMG